LTDLDANKKVYCEMDGKYNYLYVKDEYGQIWIYRFINTTMYTSSNGVKKGYATSVQLKEYFSSNIYSGKPTLTYVMPAAVPVGISVSIVLLGASIVMLIMIHRMAEEQIFKLRKNDEDFKRIHENFKTEEISKYEHQKLTKELFSNKILKNNKFFKLFTKIY